MLSEEIQSAVGKELTVRPLRKGVQLAGYMTPIDKIKLAPPKYDEAWVAAHKQKLPKNSVSTWRNPCRSFCE